MYFPDPEDDTIVQVLSRRFNCSTQQVKDGIMESAQAYAELALYGTADVRVWFWDGEPLHTIYRFDEQMVVTLYSHARKRQDVPVLVLSQGTFYEFFDSELEAINGFSREVPLQELLHSEEEQE